MNSDVTALVEYRLAQAEETLAAARELADSGHVKDAVNRAYYAMFYAALGLLASRALGSGKHTGVLGLFSQHFVKAGDFPAEAGRFLREAFDLRQKCDYREFVEVTREEAGETIAHAEVFLEETRETWRKQQDKPE